MPAIAIGIGVVGSVASGVISSNAAKSVARTQAEAAAEQRKKLDQLYAKTEAYYQPEFAAGNLAVQSQNELLGLTKRADGLDPTAQLRETPGYKFRVDEANKAVNSNAYAAGMGNSGATLKALQARGMGLADQNFNTYFDQVGSIANRGMVAKGALTDQATNYGNASNAIIQNNANAQSNATLYSANAWKDAISGVSSAVGGAFGNPTTGSSYGAGSILKSLANKGGR